MLIISKNRAWIFYIYILIGLIFIFNITNIESRKIYDYIILLLSYFIVVGLFTITCVKGKVKFFEPYTIISSLYICIMIIYPIYDYTRHNYLKEGIDVSNGCIKGTLIFILSYIFFHLGYKSTKINVQKKIKLFSEIDKMNNQIIYYISLIWWIVSFIACLYVQTSRGFSLSYIFSFGKNISNIGEMKNSGVLFLINFGPTMVMSLILIWNYSRNRVVKINILILTLIYLFMRNGRWLVLIVSLAPIVYFSIKNNKEPSKKKILFLVICGMTILSIMQFVRGNIANHQSLVNTNLREIFSLETYFAPLESDFSTYKAYYAIVEKMPSKLNYLYGEGMIGYTLALGIPRALWPTKPSAASVKVIAATLNERAVMNGQAYPNIGEFYSEFGIIGCFVLMFLYGKISSKIKILCMQNSKSALIVYSCLWPFFFQLTARIFSSNIYYMIFAMFPIVSLYLLRKIKNNYY